MSRLSAIATPCRLTGASTGSPEKRWSVSKEPSPFQRVSDTATRENPWARKVSHKANGLVGTAPRTASSPPLLVILVCKVRTFNAPQRRFKALCFQEFLLFRWDFPTFICGRFIKLLSAVSCVLNVVLRKLKTPSGLQGHWGPWGRPTRRSRQPEGSRHVPAFRSPPRSRPPLAVATFRTTRLGTSYRKNATHTFCTSRCHATGPPCHRGEVVVRLWQGTGRPTGMKLCRTCAGGKMVCTIASFPLQSPTCGD